jgi:hypothetical protein
MPETGRLENTVLRHAFSNEMGLAGWWPTSRGVLPRLGDQYLGYLLGFAVRRWFDVRGTYDETFQSGSWPADQSGWSPVHPEEHFSSQECELLMDRVTDLFSEEGKRLFRHERVSDATKVQALALAFDVTL